MKIIRIEHPLVPTDPRIAAWESLVQGSPHSGLMQSLNWAQFKRNLGMSTLHLALVENNCITGGAIFYASGGSQPGFLIAPEGPIIDWSDSTRASASLRLIVNAARTYAQEFNAIGVRIEPRLQTHSVPIVMRRFGKAPFNLIPKDTYYIDLTKSEDELLARMSSKGRYNIKLSAKHGVIVREDNSAEASSKFYGVVSEASARDGFALEFEQFFTEMHRTLAAAGIAKIILAEHDGEVLGAMLLTTYGERATYLYGGISNHKRNLMAGYALQWHAIRAAKQAGCLNYDMYGFNQFPTKEHPYSKFSEFKRKFGGIPVSFCGAHEYFLLDSLASVVIRAFKEIDTGANMQLETGRAAPFNTEPAISIS